MKREVSLYVSDILEYMEKAEKFVADLTFDEFIADEKTSYAVVRCLEIVGEATKNVPKTLRNEYTAIPWKEMAGMRDVISHIYFGVNMKKVWKAVKEDIPAIKPMIAKVLEDMRKEK